MDPEFIKDIKALRNWLQKNYSRPTGLWISFPRKSKEMQYTQIVDQVLCFGWIDSTVKTIDEHTTKLYISPRNPKSLWSKVNKNKVKELIANNIMQPSGLKMIELAKATGTWDALNDVDNLIIPLDLKKEFKKYTNAQDNFGNFSDSSKKFILQWIYTAKRPETRLKRIELTAQKADINEKSHTN